MQKRDANSTVRKFFIPLRFIFGPKISKIFRSVIVVAQLQQDALTLQEDSPVENPRTANQRIIIDFILPLLLLNSVGREKG